MIDIEKELFTLVSASLRESFPGIFVTGEYVQSPPSFPCVSIVEESNTTVAKTQSSESSENHARVMYEVNVYSNKKTGKKTECREIIQDIDNTLLSLGFSRTMMHPVPNLEDATIYRIIGRYQAVVDQNKTIYRR